MVEVHGAGPYGPSGIRKLASGLWLAGVHGSWWVLASLRSQHAGDVPHKPFKLLGLDYLKLWMLRPIAFCIDLQLQTLNHPSEGFGRPASREASRLSLSGFRVKMSSRILRLLPTSYFWILTAFRTNKVA